MVATSTIVEMTNANAGDPVRVEWQSPGADSLGVISYHNSAPYSPRGDIQCGIMPAHCGITEVLDVSRKEAKNAEHIECPQWHNRFAPGGEKPISNELASSRGAAPFLRLGEGT